MTIRFCRRCEEPYKIVRQAQKYCLFCYEKSICKRMQTERGETKKHYSQLKALARAFQSENIMR